MGAFVNPAKNLGRILILMRPHQWVKNLLLLFPPFFAGRILEPSVLSKVLPSLLSFSLIASCSYIINDIKDLEADRNHDSKRRRAIASGEISVSSASVLALSLFVFGLAVSLQVSGYFWLYLIGYLAISLSYTFFLKDTAILDIFVISLGFLIRVLAGGEAFGVSVSNWLFLTVFMVALFLASGKRLGELVNLGENAHNHRKSLAEYTPSFLEGVLWFSASSSLVTYSLYTIEQRSGLFYTVPLAVFGFLRYIYIAKDGKGDPTDALLNDKQLMAVGIIWAATIGFVLYN